MKKKTFKRKPTSKLSYCLRTMPALEARRWEIVCAFWAKEFPKRYRPFFNDVSIILECADEE